MRGIGRVTLGRGVSDDAVVVAEKPLVDVTEGAQ
jgi:hypothetical protein